MEVAETRRHRRQDTEAERDRGGEGGKRRESQLTKRMRDGGDEGEGTGDKTQDRRRKRQRRRVWKKREKKKSTHSETEGWR